MNGAVENKEQSSILKTFFYRTMKVDNHIQLAAAVSARPFVRMKLETEGENVVLEGGQTLREVFQNAGLGSDNLMIGVFNVLADYLVYQKFGHFNYKYSPFRLAQIKKTHSLLFIQAKQHYCITVFDRNVVACVVRYNCVSVFVRGYVDDEV